VDRPFRAAAAFSAPGCFTAELIQDFGLRAANMLILMPSSHPNAPQEYQAMHEHMPNRF